MLNSTSMFNIVLQNHQSMPILCLNAFHISTDNCRWCTYQWKEHCGNWRLIQMGIKHFISSLHLSSLPSSSSSIRSQILRMECVTDFCFNTAQHPERLFRECPTKELLQESCSSTPAISPWIAGKICIIVVFWITQTNSPVISRKSDNSSLRPWLQRTCSTLF